MTAADNIDVALQALELYVSAEQQEIPAAILMPPDSGEFILGNEGGYVRLAVAALKAAKGEEQKFKDAVWVGEAELDWGLAGLKHDAHAHLHLADSPPMKGESVLQRLRGYGLLGLILTPYVVGFISIVLWVESYVGRFLHK